MFIKKYDATTNDDIFPVIDSSYGDEFMIRYVSNPATANNKTVFVTNDVAISLYDVKFARRLIKRGSASDFAALFSISKRPGCGGMFRDKEGGWYQCDMEKAIRFVGMYYPRYFVAVSNIING